MKRLFAKAVLTGLILSTASAPLQAMGWGGNLAAVSASWSQWFKNGFTSLKNSISNASTETKILVGCAALATAGISYAIYLYLNPTDEELCAAAQPYIQEAQGYVALMPSIDPLDEDRLNAIGFGLIAFKWTDIALLSSCLTKSIRYLNVELDILNRRIIKYEKVKQYVSLNLIESRDTIMNLIAQLRARFEIVNSHAQYFRLHLLEHNATQRFSESLTVKENMQALVPMIKRMNNGKFPFLTFSQDVRVSITAIEQELSRIYHYEEPYASIYLRKKAALRRFNASLKVLETTILGSQEYAKDQENKEAWEKFERDEAIKKEANRIEAQKAANEKWAREEQIRIEQQRLQMQREKNQREQQAHQAQHPNARRQVFHLDDECRIQ